VSDEKKDETPQPRGKQPGIVAALGGGPNAVLVAAVVGLFGTGGVMGVERLEAKIGAQTEQITAMVLTLSKLESREQSRDASVAVQRDVSARHDDRLRAEESATTRAEYHRAAMEKTIAAQGVALEDLRRIAEDLRRASSTVNPNQPR